MSSFQNQTTQSQLFVGVTKTNEDLAKPAFCQEPPASAFSFSAPLALPSVPSIERTAPTPSNPSTLPPPSPISVGGGYQQQQLRPHNHPFPPPAEPRARFDGGPRDDQAQQILGKLQQFMNQMNSFTKSVDARLTTLERMTQEISTNQNQQSQILKDIQEATTRSSQDISSTVPPYLPVTTPVSPTHVSFPEIQTPTLGLTKTRQDLEDEEMARQLQQEFDMAQKSDTTQRVEATTSPEKCPVCAVVLPQAKLEEHVQTHFNMFESPTKEFNHKFNNHNHKFNNHNHKLKTKPFGVDCLGVKNHNTSLKILDGSERDQVLLIRTY
eukprot:CAMPEP_0201475540 /NCGR_PEP_ID=MMETSP0151_2-20130828/952_1 /ASSEMBLY_ACC=CAM_ASM_000257 /TAXON_ID=200890 /ORGANISM="Paramoeba atlantica, Strain 621/1 / CCAP 1560/9" /LENGTH=324 /DNA_ID=CAMNT_0047855661 /DNA_START=26 /DNA_END=1001 /DNA_ORIENTATION=-